MNELIKIPAERVSVILGKDGRTKKRIEKRCNVQLEVHEDGDIEMAGDSADVFFARDVIKAIGRGFNPDIAIKLSRDDFCFYLISLKEVAGSDSAVTRIKGRVIGEEGRIKTAIEEATDSYLSIYGNTIAVISRIDGMEYAKEAIGLLIDGARHATVLGYLAKAKRSLMESRLKGQ
ncbi:MAG: KH domain-containing protein [Candidatus Micrarchaeota archaeon]